MPTTPVAGDARSVPIQSYMLRIGLPIFKVDGSLITTGTGSGYVSADDGAAAAIVPTFVAGNSGNWVLDLSAAQMNGKKVSGYITSDAAGSLPTPFVIYPRACAAVHSGTARVVGGPTTSQIQLATTASDKDDAYNNCLVGITGNSGVGAIRRITDYTGSTRMATLDAAWGTAPDATSTYDVLPTQESVSLVAWKGADIVQDAIPNVAAGASGGLLVAGENASVTFAGLSIEGSILVAESVMVAINLEVGTDLKVDGTVTAGGVDVGESLSAIKIVTDKVGSSSMLEEVP